MNIRKWVGLFTKTLILGGAVGLITSFFVKYDDYMRYMEPFDIIEISGVVLYFIGFGLIFSVISQMGFFAYLFVNQFGLALFRSFWPTVQMLLIAFVLFDLVYFPYKEMDGEGSMILLILMSAAIFAYGCLIAWIKARQTRKRAFLPALFLMVVITAVEWIPGLQTSGVETAWLMITTLLACNTYQLLVLHKLTNSPSAQQTPEAADASGGGAGQNGQSPPSSERDSSRKKKN